MKKTIELQLTAGELATAFCEMGSARQADALVAIASILESRGSDGAMQLVWLREQLTAAGPFVGRFIQALAAEQAESQGEKR